MSRQSIALTKTLSFEFDTDLCTAAHRCTVHNSNWLLKHQLVKKQHDFSEWRISNLFFNLSFFESTQTERLIMNSVCKQRELLTILEWVWATTLACSGKFSLKKCWHLKTENKPLRLQVPSDSRESCSNFQAVFQGQSSSCFKPSIASEAWASSDCDAMWVTWEGNARPQKCSSFFYKPLGHAEL